MALTLASDLAFKSMKGALKRVFGSENVEKDCNFHNSYLDSQIKQENVCYTQPLCNLRLKNALGKRLST